MSLFERLKDYFGDIGISDEAQSYIGRNFGECTREDEDRLFAFIIENRARRFGFPDVQFLARAKEAVGPSGGAARRRYFWSACSECGEDYWYTMSFCPRCWKRGMACTARVVKVSDSPPPSGITRFNKEYTLGVEAGADIGGERICYSCAFSQLSFCRMFGRLDYQCRDFRECACRTCCSAARANASKWEKERTEKKPDFAVPFRKAV